MSAPPLVAIGDCTEFVLDGTHGSPVRVDAGVPVLSATNVKDGRLSVETDRFTTSDEYEAYRRRLDVRKGDVLLTIVGTIGRAAVVDDVRPFMFQRSVAVLRPRAKVLDSRYFYHALSAPGMTGRLAARTNQSAQAGVYLGALKEIEVPLPPLPEQRRIADILDKADAVRRKRREAIALTEELLRSAFLEMVGPQAAGYAKWTETSLESLAATSPSAMRTGPFGSDLRHSEFVDEGVAVLGIDNAVQNRFAWGERRYITPEKYEGLTRYTVKPNDVIVTIMGTTGRSAVVPEDIPLAITTKHLATLTLNRELAEPEFVAQAIHRHPAVLGQIEQANRGAIMSGLNLGLIKSLVVRLPPKETQREFARLTGRVRLLERCLRQAEDATSALFGSLIQRAFRDEMRVA